MAAQRRLAPMSDRLRRTLPSTLLLLAIAAMMIGGTPFGAAKAGHALAPTSLVAPAPSELVNSARVSLAHGQGPASAAPLSGLPGSTTAAALGTPWVQVGQGNQPSARATPAMAYDPADGYVVYFGGGWDLGASGNDTWTYSSGTWTNITSTLSLSPGAREDAVMTYDAADGYLVLFGGYTAGPSNGSVGNGTSVPTSYALNDTWTFVGGAWTNISSTSSTAPSPRFEPALAYDPSGGVAVLFGGSLLNGSPLSDTWTFSDGNWTDVTATAGLAPAGRDFTTFVADPTDGYAVLFGGWNSSTGTIYNDTWTFSNGAWTALSPTVSPQPLRGAMAAYDAATGSVILFGGGAASWAGPFNLQSGTWSFSGGAWADLRLSIASSPPARFSGGFTSTSDRGTLLMADGCLGAGCYSYLDLSDSWQYNASGTYGRPWVEVTGLASPSVRATPTLAYDPADHYVVYFGGGWNVGTSVNDTWTFQNNTWTNISPSLAISPTAREGSVMAYDPADGYIVLFGGYAHGGPYSSYVFSDTWKFQNGAWTNITSLSAKLPPPRFVGAMTYDSHDEYLVLFGGDALRNGADLGPTSDTWTFRAGNWTDVTATAGTPPVGRDFASFSDDPVDGYAVLFGGWESSTGTVFNDTWTFAGGLWTQLHPSVAPMPLRGAMLAYDPNGSYLVLFGGVTLLAPNWPFGLEAQTWAFKGGNWTDLSPYITTEPPARFSSGFTNIGDTGTLLMVDGCLGQGCEPWEDMHDTWLYNWSQVNGTLNLAARPSGAGQPTAFSVYALGGDGHYGYSYTGLPAGCSSADTAVLYCTPSLPGNYTVSARVADSSGRFVVLSVNLTVPGGRPVVSLGLALSSTAIDLGQPLLVTATAYGGVGGSLAYAYFGLPPGCASLNASTLACTPSQSGQFHILTTATDPLGDSASVVASLLVNPAVQVAAAVSAPAIDLGETVAFTIAASHGSQSFSYTWSTLPSGCAASSSSATFSCTPSTVGSWTIGFVASDTLGQSANAPAVSLSVNPTPTVSVSAAPDLSGDPLTVALTAWPGGGTGPYTVTWNFGDGSTGVGINVVHAYAASGTYTSTVHYADSRGFGATSSASFTVQSAPTGHPTKPIVTPPTKGAGLFGGALLGGDAAFGILIGLLAIAIVGAWAVRRRRELAEAESLVRQLELSRRGPARSSTAPPPAAPRRE